MSSSVFFSLGIFRPPSFGAGIGSPLVAGATLPPQLPQLLQVSQQLLQQLSQQSRWNRPRSLPHQLWPQPLSQQLLQVLQVLQLEVWQQEVWQQEVWQQLVSQPQCENRLNQRCPHPEEQQSLQVLQVLQELQVLQVLQVLQLEQVSQHPHEFRWNRPPSLFQQRCKQDSSQQLSQQVLHPPQQEPQAAEAEATGVTWFAGAGSAPASQAVVTKRNAAFTRYPPTSRIDFGTGPWPSGGGAPRDAVPTRAPLSPTFASPFPTLSSPESLSSLGSGL